MSVAVIAEVTSKIVALEQKITNNEEKLERKGITPEERVAIDNKIAAYTQQLTALINRRERLEQQQASAGKFLFIYFPLGYLYINHSR
jgi:hypothetical protein